MLFTGTPAGIEVGSLTASSPGTSVATGLSNAGPASGHFFPLSVAGAQTKAGSNLNAAGINASMSVSGDLGGSAGVGDADWGVFAFGNASNLTGNPAFYETDGGEFEATYAGSLANGNNYRLVSLGAQSWVNNTSPSTTAAVPHAVSIWARAPYLNGSAGSGTITDALSLSVDEPSVGTLSNDAIEINPSPGVSSNVAFLLGGNPHWDVQQVDHASSHSYDFAITNAVYNGIGLRLQNSANGDAYIGAEGSGGVVICGAPTFGGESPTTQCTGGLQVFAGGASSSENPVAASGLIRIPNAQFLTSRNANDSGDVSMIGVNSANQVSIDANAQGTVVGGTFAFGGGSALSTSNATGTGDLVLASGPSIMSPMLTGDPVFPSTVLANGHSFTYPAENGTGALTSQLPVVADCGIDPACVSPTAEPGPVEMRTLHPNFSASASLALAGMPFTSATSWGCTVNDSAHPGYTFEVVPSSGAAAMIYASTSNSDAIGVACFGW